MDDQQATETLGQRYARQAWERYAAQVAAGEHDDQCEIPDRPWICHCSKRKREAEGFTQPPGDLHFPPPYCPRCWSNCEHDGDGWTCPKCPVAWESNGTGAHFTDDYGDLGAPAPSQAVTSRG